MTLEYELLYTGDTNTDKAQMMGLLDVEKLESATEKNDYDANKLGQSKQKIAPSKAQVSTKSDQPKTSKAIASMPYRETSQSNAENAQAL